MSKKTFEAAYDRLEEILEKMNTEQVSLDSALTLYEEADGLIGDCQKRLTEAEQKIEILMKNRDGSLQVDEKGTAKTEDFASSNSTIFSD